MFGTVFVLQWDSGCEVGLCKELTGVRNSLCVRCCVVTASSDSNPKEEQSSAVVYRRDALYTWVCFLGEKDGSWGKYEDPELISGTADSVPDWQWVYTWLTIFVNRTWFLVPLYTLLPGAKSRWHTGSFPNYFLLKHAQIISVIISLPSSTLLTLASNLKNYSEILIILFACCVEDEVRVCVCVWGMLMACLEIQNSDWVKCFQTISYR